MAPKIIVAENNDQVATELIKIVKGALDKIGDSSEKAIVGLSGKEIRGSMVFLLFLVHVIWTERRMMSLVKVI